MNKNKISKKNCIPKYPKSYLKNNTDEIPPIKVTKKIGINVPIYDFVSLKTKWWRCIVSAFIGFFPFNNLLKNTLVVSIIRKEDKIKNGVISNT